MLFPLMSSQFLETTIPFSTVVRAAGPETVVLDPKMDRLPVSVEIAGTGECLGAVSTWCTLGSWNIHGKVE